MQHLLRDLQVLKLKMLLKSQHIFEVSNDYC